MSARAVWAVTVWLLAPLAAAIGGRAIGRALYGHFSARRESAIDKTLSEGVTRSK